MLPFSGVFAGLIYFMVKFQCSFAVFWATYYLNSCVGIALAYAVAAFSPTTEAANALLPTYVTTNIFFTLKRHLKPKSKRQKWDAGVDARTRRII